MNKERLVEMRSGDMATDFLGGKEMEVGWIPLGYLNNLGLVLYLLPFQMAISCQAKFNRRVNVA